MKFLLLSFTLLVSFFSLSMAYASDAISLEEIDALEQQGKALILGELTGVGKAIPIDQVDSFVTVEGTISVKQVVKIEFKANTTTTVNNITQLVLADKVIPREQLKGLILK